MGSHNSEHSGSMNSDEFSAFIGHNYGFPSRDNIRGIPLQLEADIQSLHSGNGGSQQSVRLGKSLNLLL